MLSKAAEAALLKTLEEPPAHVVFVLATTDPQKVSPTIAAARSTSSSTCCPRTSSRRTSASSSADAGLEVADEAIEAVLRQGGGSARDTLSALDQVVAAGGLAPDARAARRPRRGAHRRATRRGRWPRSLRSMAAGRDARDLTEDLVAHLRDAFLSLIAPELVRAARSAPRTRGRPGPAGSAPAGHRAGHGGAGRDAGRLPPRTRPPAAARCRPRAADRRPTPTRRPKPCSVASSGSSARWPSERVTASRAGQPARQPGRHRRPLDRPLTAAPAAPVGLGRSGPRLGHRGTGRPSRRRPATPARPPGRRPRPTPASRLVAPAEAAAAATPGHRGRSGARAAGRRSRTSRHASS